jgi:formylglycine-generating enzyme required for sulfatase activity
LWSGGETSENHDPGHDPVPPAPAERGTLEFHGEDAPVQVTLLRNGQVVKTLDLRTERKIELEPGDYQLRLQPEAKGLELSTRALTIKPGQSHAVTLKQRTPSVAKEKPPAPSGPPPAAMAPFTANQARQFQQQWAEYLKREVVEQNSLGMKLAVIPPGEFIMGASPADIEREEALRKKEKHRPTEDALLDQFRHEGPQHRVKIARPFALGVYEVTVGQFRQFVKASSYKTECEKDGKGGIGVADGLLRQRPEFNWRNVGYSQTERHPVMNIRWPDAVAFCAWLSAKEKRLYRLPTEAEWEYTCRAGTATRTYWGKEPMRNYAWFNLPAEGKTQAVGSRLPNAFGLHDMCGNVWEWCADWYSPTYYREAPLEAPGPAAGTEHVIRGGAARGYAYACCSTFRGIPEKNSVVGFRVLCELAR